MLAHDYCGGVPPEKEDWVHQLTMLKHVFLGGEVE